MMLKKTKKESKGDPKAPELVLRPLDEPYET
jgi:hypothetical protein